MFLFPTATLEKGSYNITGRLLLFLSEDTRYHVSLHDIHQLSELKLAIVNRTDRNYWVVIYHSPPPPRSTQNT